MKKKKKIASKFVTTLSMLLVLSIFVVNCSEIEYDLLFGRRMAAEMPTTLPDDIVPNEYVSEDIEAPVEPEVPEAPVLSELEMRIMHYEFLVQTEGTSENFMQLASLYNEAGMILRQRDTLERSFRLNNDQEAFEQLQSIVVNVYEENTIIQEKMWALRDALRFELLNADAIGMVTNDLWLAVMMPVMSEGKRNYYLEDPSDWSVLYVEVGYDASNNNMPFTRAWHHMPGNGEIVSIFQSGNMVQLLHSGFADGSFDGEFSLLTCVVNGDTIHHDVGTFVNGRLVGDFSSSIYSVSERTDLISLFNSRHDVEYVTFYGNFDEYGQTTVTQPASAGDDRIVFALTENGRRYLYHSLVVEVAQEDEDAEDAGETEVVEADVEEESDEFRFDYAFLGLSTLPEFEPYSPVFIDEPQQSIVELDMSQVQIRIFGSVVQWFDGSVWHDMGGLIELLTQDPHLSDLVSIKSVSDIVAAETSEDGGIISTNINRGVAEVPVERPRNNAPRASTPQQPATPQPPAGGGGGGGGGGAAPPPPPPQPPPQPPPVPPPTGDGGEFGPPALIPSPPGS